MVVSSHRPRWARTRRHHATATATRASAAYRGAAQATGPGLLIYFTAQGASSPAADAATRRPRTAAAAAATRAAAHVAIQTVGHRHPAGAITPRPPPVRDRAAAPLSRWDAAPSRHPSRPRLRVALTRIAAAWVAEALALC